jgi:hypothetical protein
MKKRQNKERLAGKTNKEIKYIYDRKKNCRKLGKRKTRRKIQQIFIVQPAQTLKGETEGVVNYLLAACSIHIAHNLTPRLYKSI